jgi:hypothetical protein
MDGTVRCNPIPKPNGLIVTETEVFTLASGNVDRRFLADVPMFESPFRGAGEWKSCDQYQSQGRPGDRPVKMSLRLEVSKSRGRFTAGRVFARKQSRGARFADLCPAVVAAWQAEDRPSAGPPS